MNAITRRDYPNIIIVPNEGKNDDFWKDVAEIGKLCSIEQ